MIICIFCVTELGKCKLYSTKIDKFICDKFFFCYERLQLSDCGNVHGSSSSVIIWDLDYISGVQLIHRRRLKAI